MMKYVNPAPFIKDKSPLPPFTKGGREGINKNAAKEGILFLKWIAGLSFARGESV
jgi:hypothetical protein